MQVKEFIRRLPKAELHLHLEGALPWQMSRVYAADSLPEKPEWWADNYKFENFTHFLQMMALSYRHVLTGVARYQQVARAVFENLASQNARYVEISFSLEWAIAQGLLLSELAAAIKNAAPNGLTVCVFGGLSRDTQQDLSDNVIDALFRTPNLDGLDLHGDETLQGPAPFQNVFLQARERGLMTKAHAGELVGFHSVADTLDLLQVKRIEHGTTAIQNEELMNRLIAENITLDMCPWSNVKLNVVEDITRHPIRQFLKRGIRVTVNTDDPTVFGYSLTQEIQSLASNLGFEAAELAQLQKNAFRVASMPPEKKQAVNAEIDALLEDWGTNL